MTPPGSGVLKEDPLSYGPEFLNCLRLLYGESLRLGLGGLSDVLEKTFEDCVLFLKAQSAFITDEHPSIVEFNYLKEFRRLDQAPIVGLGPHVQN